MEETTIDLRDIVKTLKKRRGLIFYTFLTFVVIAAVVSLLIPPTYEAETSLRVKQPKGLANSLLSEIVPGGSNNTKQLMSTYAEILQGRTVVETVIAKMPEGKDKKPSYEQFAGRITTQSLKDTEILKVKVQASSAEEAKFLANSLVEAFNARMTSLVRSEQSAVREFIGERMQTSKKELDQAERVLEKYKQDEKIVSPADETKALIERLSTVDKLSAENQVALATAQATAAGTAQQLAKEKPGFIADSPLIQQYKGKLSELEVELVTLLSDNTEKHPKVIATRAAISETREKLDIEINRIVNAEAPSMNPIHQELVKTNLQAEVGTTAYSARQGAINKIIGENEQILTSLPTKERGLARVLRDATVAQEIYIMLAKRHEEARINEVMQPTDVQVVEVAVAPDKPIKPKKTQNVLIAGILGLFIGTGVSFALEYMNRTIRTPEDVQQYLDLPVLGSIPHFDSDTREPEGGAFDKLKRLLARKDDRHHHHDS